MAFSAEGTAISDTLKFEMFVEQKKVQSGRSMVTIRTKLVQKGYQGPNYTGLLQATTSCKFPVGVQMRKGVTKPRDSVQCPWGRGVHYPQIRQGQQQPVGKGHCPAAEVRYNEMEVRQTLAFGTCKVPYRDGSL